jgi:hypothetical protein
VCVGVDDAAHEGREGHPRVAFVGQGTLGLGDVSSQAFGAEPPKELLLAGVATVQGADPDPGALGHRVNGSLRVGDEHLAGGLQDQTVVASRLGLTSPQGSRPHLGCCLPIHETSIAHLEQNVPFIYNNGT